MSRTAAGTHPRGQTGDGARSALPRKQETDAAYYAGFESIPIGIHVRIGRVTCSLGRLLALEAGEIIPLDRAVGSSFELFSGDRLLARVRPVADDDAIQLKVVRLPGEEESDGGD